MIYYCQPVKGINQLLPGWRLFGYKELKKAQKIYEHDKDGFLVPNLSPHKFAQ